MEVFTTEPGLQCYTGCNMKPEVFGKGGVEYRKLASVCLETQHYANSVNQASQSKSVQFLQMIIFHFGFEWVEKVNRNTIESKYSPVNSEKYWFLINSLCFSAQLPQYDPPPGSNLPSHHCVQIRTGIVMLYHCVRFFFILSMIHWIYCTLKKEWSLIVFMTQKRKHLCLC